MFDTSTGLDEAHYGRFIVTTVRLQKAIEAKLMYTVLLKESVSFQ